MTESAPLGPEKGQLVAVLGLVAGPFLLRWLLDRLLFRPTARHVLLKDSAKHKAATPLKKQRDIDRFCESFWKCVCYSTLCATGIYALHDQPWAVRPKEFWSGWPHFNIPRAITAYYAAELAFYGSGIFMLACWEERRNDFAVMMLHHVVSVFLIMISYNQGFARVGSVIMLLHDPSDIFLEGAKLCNYAGWESPSVLLFILLLVTWFGLRLVVLPGWIITSIWWDLPAKLGRPLPLAMMLSAFLCLLVVLHAYWFYLIAKIAVGAAAGNLRDTRESDE